MLEVLKDFLKKHHIQMIEWQGYMFYVRCKCGIGWMGKDKETCIDYWLKHVIEEK